MSYTYRFLSFIVSYRFELFSADIMRIVWLRTGSNPADINQFRMDPVKGQPYRFSGKWDPLVQTDEHPVTLL